MQDQNDNMDDLFRKAAEDYPLNVGVPDWNKIAGAVSAAENTAQRSDRRYRRFLWLLLLIPFGIGAAYVADERGWIGNKQGSEQTVLADKLGDTQKITSSGDSRNADSEQGRSLGENPDHPNSVDKRSVDQNSVVQNAVPEKTLSEKSTADKTNRDNSTIDKTPANNPATDQTTEGNNSINKKSDNKSGNTSGLSASEPKQNHSGGNANDGLNNALANKTKEKSPDQENRSFDSDRSTPEFSSDPKRSVVRRNPSSGKLLTSFDPAAGSFIKSRSKHHKKNTRGEYDSARPRQQVGATEEETGLLSKQSPEPALNIKGSWDNDSARVEASGEFLNFNALPAELKDLVRTKRVPRFYIGIAGGVDLSTVKLQKFSRTGSQYGGIVGYQFGKKWSVEAGLFMDTKYYFTDGEYFDKGGLTVNPTSKILSIDGVCRMFEIPVSVKYDLSNSYRSNWFVTAGLSSYIMKKENYDMLYLYTGSGSTSVHKYEYLNSSRNFFSQLRLTAGYAYKLPRNFSLRLEPYVNIPVSGVGYGKLNLNSAGINAGIFKRIF